MTSKQSAASAAYLHEPVKRKFNTDDLKRLFYEELLIDELSLAQIQELKDQTMHIHPKMEKFAFQEREEGMNEYARRFALHHKFMQEHGYGAKLQTQQSLVLDLTRFHLDYGLVYLHKYAFQPAVQLLASEAQWAKYGQKINNLEIIGSYVQTELGHGSDVQSLQTTAEFDVDRQEFVFNTPDIKAIKFYPGVLGKCANFALLMARLISNKVDYGVQAFLVNIRDVATHMPLPGIEVGDIGTKAAFPFTDNGYLLLKQFRQPKECLLNRYVDIRQDGTFEQLNPKAKQLVYGGMLNLRILIVYSGLIYLGKQVAIVSHYARNRKQFPGTDKKEVPVIYYQGLQYKIAPCIASNFALLFTVSELYAMNEQYTNLLFESGGKDPKLFQILAKLHMHTAVFKAIATGWGDHFGELLKQGAGGHGYLVMGGLTRPHLDFGIGVATAEGDNVVLSQQTSKALIKQLQTGEINPDQFQFSLSADLTVEEQLCLLFEIRFKTQLKRVGLKVQELISFGKDFATTIWNDHCQVELVEAAMYYGQWVMVQTFLEVLKGKQQYRVKTKMTDRPAEVQDLMKKMLRVFAIYQIHIDQMSFTKNLGTDEQLQFFREKAETFKQVMREDTYFIAMHAEQIVEAFDFRDEELLSTIGSKNQTSDDQVYERMLEVVRQNPMNKNPVPKGFNTYMAQFPKL